MQNKHSLLLGTALALLAADAARAQTTTVAAAAPQAAAASSKADKGKDSLTAMPSADDFRPKGPANIGGDHLESVKGDTSVTVLTGNVTLDSDTLKMDGDRLEMKKFPDTGGYTAKVTGTPAHMSHAGTGPDNPPITAHAKTITYDSRTAMINLVGDAQLTKSDQIINAQTMDYNVRDKSYQADRGEGPSRVIITVPQVPNSPPPARAPGSAKPQPAAPAPAATPQGGAQTAPQAPAP